MPSTLVSPSLKRWCDQGLLTAIRTPGGHRRLAMDDVCDFLRQSGRRLVHPELLGLPGNLGQGLNGIEQARNHTRLALIDGSEDQCRRVIFDLFLGGHSACEICDAVLAPAFHDLGELWASGRISIYRERPRVRIGIKSAP